MVPVLPLESPGLPDAGPVPGLAMSRRGLPIVDGNPGCVKQ